ncbi:hypothetical protein MPTK1_3g08360 [Marchantia polymorpha subsp. ruderalis]|uniref:Leucine-rich repeat-containing N-terminal plant-type domain-containing protein n=2 Tax=Marchantia polymorpha TaxID=3197 RepID=A0AAF6AYN4_MARPO|nr:hypothetical protein MARPO_0006s0310 [Marchantia polymorpha]BBN04868.1 hypothetical protein Mp_3g08360 [Marchantia polymorpha subsp. ruderalis]|eukprot:PTQ48319.1 hypothetical protein MARPO_0006s0310 [Marchantia polymorpha]
MDTMHFLGRSTGRASVVSSPDLPAICERFRMLLILVLCCLQLGACAVDQEDNTFGEISRIETLVETLQDPDIDARTESAGNEHVSINIESGHPPAASIEAHMGQLQAQGGPSSQRELQQFRLQDEAVDTSLTTRHEPHHGSLEESTHSRRISRTLLQDSFGEADALLQFKAEIENYTDNALDGWTTGNRSTYCSWTRVICDDELHVISLNFSGLKMNGTLGPSLSKLEYLEDLDLSHNFLLSELPVEWGRLQRLQTLNVHDNSLFGGVPAEYGNMSSLRVLYIGVQGWFFNGSIPEELGLLSELEVLALGTLFNFDAKQDYYPYRSNKMRGPIPKSIANCTKLWYLDFFGNNNLSGSIPREYGQLVNLEYLSFEQNNFTGSIPSELRNLTKIKFLNLGNNALEGTFPEELASLSELEFLNVGTNFLGGSFLTVESTSWSRLEKLFIDGNEFGGFFPTAVTTMTALTKFYMFNNHFTGYLPENLGRLANLREFSFRSNLLFGDLPESLNNCTQLFLLDAADNFLTGTLNPLRNLSLLVLLDAANNNLTGTLDPLRNLSLLVLLNAANNRLTGTLDPLRNLSLLSNMNLGTSYLLLNDNDFRGPIPAELGKLPKLKFFFLHNNGLSGPIPTSLADLKSVVQINLSNNSLTGDIPPDFGVLETLEYLGLHINALTGRIPPELGRLQKMVKLILHSNNLTGSIPASLANCSSLRSIRLSNNKLTGTVTQIDFLQLRSLESFSVNGNQLVGGFPVSVYNCTDLNLLDLSSNGFSGELPDNYDQGWYSQPVLSDLRVLGLSSNKFGGSVPGWIWKLPKLQVLDLSHNSFAGVWLTNLSGLEGFSHLLASPDDRKRRCSSVNNDKIISVQVEVERSTLLGQISIEAEQIFIDAKRSRLEYLLESRTFGQQCPTVHLLTLEYVLETLISIDLSYNQLSGRLPYSLGALRGLTYLNLAHNNFSGEIPQVFEDLLRLESLDLSANYLTGKIPAVVLSWPWLGYLNLSYNFLEGEIPTVNTFSKRYPKLIPYTISSYKPGNDQLCGPPLETTCGSSATLGAPSSELLDGTFWRAFEIGTAIGVVVVIGVVIGTLRTMPCSRYWLLHTQDIARHFKQGRYGGFNEPT